MNFNEYFSNRLKEVFISGKWVVGTNIKTEIIDLNWKDAITKVNDFNTIAALTFHLHYYIAGVKKVLEGGTLEIRDKYSFDAPPIESAEDWQNLVHRFITDAEQFIDLIANMTNEEILSDFVKKEYGSYARNIDVMIEHSFYHLGQIVIIKKHIKQNRAIS